MATIKSHTDLDQSRKLAGILSIESADMCWCNENDVIMIPYIDALITECPAWSLTALLNVLPNGTDVVKEKADTENERYMCTVLIKDSLITTFASNPVDACVDAIIKLNKQL